MGSSLMRALKPAQPIEPTEITDMPDQPDQVPSMEAPSIPPAEEDIPVSPVAPEIGQSPDQDMTPPPGNWTVSHYDLYSQRQQVQSPSLNEPEVSTPGTAPKARGPWFVLHITVGSFGSIINDIIIHSKYFPKSDWLKAHA